MSSVINSDVADACPCGYRVADKMRVDLLGHYEVWRFPNASERSPGSSKIVSATHVRAVGWYTCVFNLVEEFPATGECKDSGREAHLDQPGE
jgi:hypothetical protein